MKELKILPPGPAWCPDREKQKPFWGGMGLLAIALLARDPALAAGLNDTGVIRWYSPGASNGLPSEPDANPGQDASHGRDAAARFGILAKVGGGSAGFDFTKIDATGTPLPADAATWSCVRDNVTGLSWEMKTDDGGLHDKDWTYTWYNSTGVNDGGSAGTAAGGECGGTVAAGCDTEKFAAAVNAGGLCGATDWRLPSRKELMSLVDNNRNSPAIDTNYFPNTTSLYFWSSSPYAESSDDAWAVNFMYGSDAPCANSGYGCISGGNRHYVYSVRLVRDGQ